MPTCITEEGQDYWFFVLRPSGSNAWCVWQILSVDDTPRVAQSSIIDERNERITKDPTPRVTDEWKHPLMVGGRVDNDGIYLCPTHGNRALINEEYGENVHSPEFGRKLQLNELAWPAQPQEDNRPDPHRLTIKLFTINCATNEYRCMLFDSR